MNLTTIATATLVAATVTLTPAPASAGALCWVTSDLCGIVTNAASSTYDLRYRCDSTGTVKVLVPGESSPHECRDASGFIVGSTHRVYRWDAYRDGSGVWVRQAEGFHGISDGTGARGKVL